MCTRLSRQRTSQRNFIQEVNSEVHYAKACAATTSRADSLENGRPDRKAFGTLTSNNGVAFIIKSAAKYLVRVTFKHLSAGAALGVPQARRLVGAGGEYHRPLGIKAYLQ